MWWLGQGLWIVGAAWYLLVWSFEQWQSGVATSVGWWQTGKYCSVVAIMGGLALASQTPGERLLWVVVACVIGVVWYLGRNASAR